MVNEASESGPDYQQFFKKALKKFKVAGPEDLESDKTKKKFFNYVDNNFTSEKERQASAAPKEKEEEPKEKEEVTEAKYAFGNPTKEGIARKKVWTTIIKYSNNMSHIKKLGALADSISGTKTPIVDSDDVHELVDGLTGEQFEKFYYKLMHGFYKQP